MRYIKFGERQKEVSEVVLGLMRISEMTVYQVEELIESALAVGLMPLILLIVMVMENVNRS